jgi:hypothetical protein
MAEIDDLRKQLEDLNKQIKEAGGLGINFDEAIKRAGNDVKVLQTYIAQLNKQLNDTVNNSEYIYRTFQDLTSELRNQNLLLKAGKNSFKVFTDIAQDLNYYQKGTNDLTDKQFNRIKQNIGLEKEELKFVVDRLNASKLSRDREVGRLNLLERLDSTQATRLKELNKENELLINANEALLSGLPILEKELNLSKKISDSRKELGGATKAAADLLSKYGGSLAQFFNISEASEAVEEYNKDLIKNALQNKDLQDKLLNIEKEKFDVGKKLEENLNTIHNSNRTLDTKERIAAHLQASAQEELNKLDQKQVDLKNEAINKTVELTDKSKILKVFTSELGEGLKKALNDPIVRLTIGLKLLKSGFNDIKKAFNIFLEFDKVFTNTARGLGMSTDQVTKMAKAARLSGDQFGKNVYTAEQITKAIGESNAQLGLSVDLGANTTSEFAAMTNQMGLSAEEATNIYKLGLLNNMSLEDTNKTIASSIIATQKQTGVQVNAKQVLQEIGKLSAGITSKFQQNPEALAKAVTQAKALGTNLEQVDKVGESILNFESSIENELKAELLTGKQINLEKARYAALTGDQATLTAELADQVGSLGEFQEMNVLAQKSLAEAFGLSRDEVADMLIKQETFNKLGDVSKKSAQEQLEIARERGLSEEDSLVKNLQQQAAAEKLEATFDKLKSTLAGIVQGPLGTLVTFMAELLKNSFAVYGILGIALAGSIVKLVLGFGQLIKVAQIFKKLEIGSAIAAAAKAAFSSPLGQVTGGLAAIGLLAASVGAIMAAVNTATNADDFKSVGDDSSGHGNRMLLTPEGTFKINNKDTIIGGTDKSFNMASPSTGINKSTTPMINYGITKEDMKETFNDLLNGILNRPQPTPQFALNIDGRQIGTAVGKQMETGTAQNISTGYKIA